MKKIWSINDIQTKMREMDSHWWDYQTMQSSETKILGGVYQGGGGVFFATSEDNYDKSGRTYSVHQFFPSSYSLQRISNISQYKYGEKLYPQLTSESILILKTHREAKRGAKILAGGRLSTVCNDKLIPITPLEDFERTLITHKCGGVTTTRLFDLMGLAKKHHYYCECQCGIDHPDPQKMAELGEKMVGGIEKKIIEMADLIGVKGVVFSGDPRGVTVKLQMYDGYTDDWGREGVCVPTPNY